MGRVTLFQTQFESSYCDPGHTPRSENAFDLLEMILAPSLSVIRQILWNLLVSERQVHLRLVIEEMEGPPPPLVVSSMDRLTDLLDKSEPVLRAALPPEPPDLFHPSQPLPDADAASKQTPPLAE